MKKFSYGLEFYKCNIFDISNPKLFKRKVIEAESIEKHFSTLLPNVERVRKYIIRSFRMKPRMNAKDRINYIIGLIYADDYINVDDLYTFAEYIENKKYPELENKSIWWVKDYYEMPEDVDFFGNELSDTDEVCLVSSKSVDHTSEDECDEDDYEDEDDLEYSPSTKKEDLRTVDPDVKIDEFKKHKKKFIELILENKDKSEDEKRLIRRAMNDWIDFSINALKDMYAIKRKSIEYKMENISKFV